MFKLQGDEGREDESLLLLAVGGNTRLCCPLVVKRGACHVSGNRLGVVWACVTVDL